ncbi:TetR/AcrR family transcriptional regulator [Catenovulum sp. SM1970]|uniref:TetR/AcrR family transcriptional regulator n=1 Tax=Marinifaba aquimaris TaxID=2741323 RepID=UPI001571708C|nr:TetR/AcrR family transcriptional regulator [Marinifaba aquimaris]NTS76317.1 TetR/AcrR family transcriptional regulator [Marinifaba aquimaris]
MSQKRQLLIDTALELFYQQGINSIGINEVLKQSGVAKRTLYSHFDSKEALILAALEQRHQVFISWFSQQISQVSNANEMIEAVFDALASWFNGCAEPLGAFKGCFFINTSAEFSDQNSATFHFCQAHKQAIKTAINTQLPTINAELVDTLCLLKEGAIVSVQLLGNATYVIALSKRNAKAVMASLN